MFVSLIVQLLSSKLSFVINSLIFVVGKQAFIEIEHQRLFSDIGLSGPLLLDPNSLTPCDMLPGVVSHQRLTTIVLNNKQAAILRNSSGAGHLCHLSVWQASSVELVVVMEAVHFVQSSSLCSLYHYRIAGR